MPIRSRLRHALSGTALVSLAGACARPVAAPSVQSPLAAKRVEARRGVVSASNPEAARAGLLMLERGGNAVDAAVATAFALAVVDPSQTGIGGYGSTAIYMRGARRADVIEAGSESGADPAWSGPDRVPVPEGGRTPRLALVPGFVAGLLLAHERHGRLPREAVLAPAVRLAREGFVVGPALYRQIVSGAARLADDAEAMALFQPGGQPLRPGERLVQAKLAEILERIGREGAPAFYEGDFPRRVAAKVRAVGGLLDAADFAAYRARARRPVCSTYLRYTLLGVGSPMAAHTLAEAMNVAELAGIEHMGDPTTSPASATRLADAMRLSLADRRGFHGNPDWQPTPVRGLASRGFARSRLSHVGGPVADTLAPGDAWAHENDAPAPACARFDPYPASATQPAGGRAAAPTSPNDAAGNTSHLSVIDAERNAVSMTTSVGVLWGSGVYAEGMFLNSSGNLFDPSERGPRRRPTGLTMPMLALEGDDVRLAVGAAGGAYIGAAVGQVTFRVLGLGQDPWLAVAAPRFQVNPTSRVLDAEGGFALPVYEAWRTRGYLPASRIADLSFAAVHTVLARKDGILVGAADPRRDGAAVGY